MRKLILPMVVMAGMILAACSGGATSNTPTGGAPLGTVFPTGEATMATTGEATMSTTSEATSAATSEATMDMTPAATSGTSEATMAATNEATTGTPAATSDSTGSTGSTPTATQYISLTTLLKGQIAASDNSQVGQVTGVLIQHPVISTSGSMTPTEAPTATQGNFVVRYLLVNNTGASSSSSSSSGDVVLVPWQALNVASTSNGSTGSTASAGTYTLTVSSSAFTGAPTASMTDIQNGTGTWASGVDSYWTSQGLTIPLTGSTSNNPSDYLFLLTSADGLKVSDQANNTLGAASDVFIDPATGEIVYIQVNTGSSMGNRTVVIPSSFLNWNPGSAAAAVNNAGQFVLNLPAANLANFPSIDLSNGLNANTIDQLNQYWQSIQK